MKYKNVDIEGMIASLAPLLERTDRIGYAAARNTRVLSDQIREYTERKEQLIAKYGEEELDDEGNPTGQISLSAASENFPKFAEELKSWATVEQEPDILKIPCTDVIGNLSGHEILAIDWMLED